MQTLKALLVDDETNSRTVLRSLIGRFFPEIIVVAEAANVEEAFQAIQQHAPELVFLDIQMPGGDGFNLLRKWDETPFDVIFVTSFDNFAIHAISFSALGYLLKPVEVEHLRNAIEKALRNAEKRETNRLQIENVLHNISTTARDRKIAVHVHDKVKLLPVSQIAYIVADTSWSHITMADEEKYMMAKNLKEFEEFFSTDPDFIRVHKSYLVNVAFITEYSKGDPCIITMSDGKTFEVARRKKREILERVNKI